MTAEMWYSKKRKQNFTWKAFSEGQAQFIARPRNKSLHGVCPLNAMCPCVISGCRWTPIHVKSGMSQEFAHPWAMKTEPASPPAVHRLRQLLQKMQEDSCDVYSPCFHRSWHSLHRWLAYRHLLPTHPTLIRCHSGPLWTMLELSGAWMAPQCSKAMRMCCKAPWHTMHHQILWHVQFLGHFGNPLTEGLQHLCVTLTHSACYFLR